MASDYLFILFCLNIASLQAYNNEKAIHKILDIIKRRYSYNDNIVGVPTDPGDLPQAEPILPGHTLINPSLNMLKSAIKFPHTDLNTAVYGNWDNLGITYGKTNKRVLYTDFRKSTDRILDLTIIQALKNIAKSNGNKKRATEVIVVELKPSNKRNNDRYGNKSRAVIKNTEDENDASEILDNSSSTEEQGVNLRRSRHRKPRHKDRNRNKLYSNEGSSSADSRSSNSDSRDSSDDKNPGNPFTIHHGKYKQNWMWNHNMDGDHMNINPYGPSFSSPGPSGPDLFFGRKWWYFNQDDYRPLK